MRNLPLVIVLSGLAAATATPGQDQGVRAPSIQLTPAEIAQGWHVLFDGTSTAAWRGYGQAEFPAEGWTIEAGTLHHLAGGGGGDLITRRRYGNFEFAFQWRTAEGANSGVMYRVVESDRPSHETGPEYQVLDDAKHDAAGTVHGAAALYGLYAAEGAPSKPAGEWNDGRILVFGDHVEHWLNGQKVIDATIGSEDWKSRVAGSKFEAWDAFASVRRGHLCLQDHGDEVWYRSLRMRELPPGESRYGEEVVLFDGSDLSQWDCHLSADVATLDDVWSIRDEVLICKGQPAGYLFTRRSFSNFVLRLQWRWDPEAGAGNSGVLLRQNGEHGIWPRSIEAQLQSGNAGDFWCIGEYPMQVAPDRTKGRNTKRTHGTEKALGEWNTYEIVVDDGWVSLRINGEVVNEAWDCAVIPGPICLQSEGAEIWFRDVRLVELGD